MAKPEIVPHLLGVSSIQPEPYCVILKQMEFTRKEFMRMQKPKLFMIVITE